MSDTATGPAEVPALTDTEVVPGPPESDGDALASLVHFLDLGGPVLWVLGALSVIALALILAKLLQFSIARLGSRSAKGPLAVVANASRDTFESQAQDRASGEDAGRRMARRYMRPLESGLGTLGMIAMLSPLIGLLGTVIGMISAFQALETAGSTVDPSLLSAGIWVALLTTAAGLVVAIPATLAHGWFEGRLSRFADEAECAIGQAMAAASQHVPDLRVAAE
ncbi:MAG: MotA/TolQ/ExbB proton channel family protein [Pseudomonadota bacterium]